MWRELFHLPSLFFLGRSPFSLEEMMSSRYWLIHSSQDHCSALHRTSWQAGFIQIVVVSFPAGIPSSTVHVVSSFFFNGIKHNCSPIKGGTKCSLNFLSYTFTFRGLQAARLYWPVPLTELWQLGNRTLSNTIGYKCGATGNIDVLLNKAFTSGSGLKMPDLIE